MTGDDELDQEILLEFLVEADELVARLDRELVELEASPTDEVLASVFRNLHTIKGSAGFLGLANVEAIAHEGEALLSSARSGDIVLDSEGITALLQCVDGMRFLMQQVRQVGADTGLNTEPIVLALQRANVPKPEASGSFADSEVSDNSTLGDPQDAKDPGEEAEDTSQATVENGASDAPSEKAGLEVNATSATVSESTDTPALKSEFDSIRVDVGVLDELMTVVSELVLTRNQLRNEMSDATGSARTTLGRLSTLTSDLQVTVMKTRMQPIAHLFGKYPRIVRDLAATLGKSVHLDLVGGDTELDRALIEAFRDPLTHLVRNAIDHGIETPEERTAKGKPAEGNLVLRARHESGHVVVSITDDGSGLNYAKILEKAQQRGIVASDANLTPAEIADLVFAPGFSTAEKVSNVSGRGVGMDVVKTQIEGIGGSVSITSHEGSGTTVTAVIPLTLAIMPSLLVECGGQRFAIPQASVEELVLARPHEWERIAGTPVLRLRERLLPMVSLAGVFAIDSASPSRVVVVKDGELRYGILVDSSPGTEEIVIKPLDPLLSEIPVYSGATILPDGTVALVLDIAGLAQLSGVSAVDTQSGQVQAANAQDSIPVVFLKIGSKVAAVDLSEVERLEEFPAEELQTAAGVPVVRYRDGLLPLWELSPGALYASDIVQAVVLRDPEADLGVRGIVVDQVLDIGSAVVVGTGNGSGVNAEVLMDSTVADLLDAQDLVRRSR